MDSIVVDKALLQRVAKNARLNLTEKEIEILLPQFKQILEAFAKVSQVDVEGVKPAFHPIEVKNVYREDLVAPCLDNASALSNTRHKKNGFFKGPKVV